MKQLMNYIEFVRIIDIEQVLQDGNGRITDFKLKNGAKRYCYLTDKEHKFTNKAKTKDRNRSYDIELKGYAEIPPEDVIALNGRLTISGVSNDEQMFWIGSMDLPATVTLIPDLNSCEINVSCQSLMPIF